MCAQKIQETPSVGVQKVQNQNDIPDFRSQHKLIFCRTCRDYLTFGELQKFQTQCTPGVLSNRCHFVIG